MKQHTRRDFLKTSAAGGAMLLGSGTLSAAEPDPAAANALQMCIARWKGAPASETELKAVAVKLTEQAVAALGGMKRFVKKGETVWVKPNMAWDRTPEQAANTNPDVVATLVRLSLEAGAKSVKVGDAPCNDARKAYPNSGIEAAARAAGAEIVYLDKERFRDTAINGAKLKSWLLYPELIESDVVINVPIAKQHVISKVTLCMKNYMGIISGNRGQWHPDLANCLTDISMFMKPKTKLCVLDAVRILTANGPTGGNLADVKRLDTIAAGTDIVALDAFGCELLGVKPDTIEFLKQGQAAGLGKMEYRTPALKELEVT